MNYPIVYDCMTTDFDNHGLAVLENASNVKVREVINGEFLLSFILPRNDPKWQHIKEENFVKVYDASQKKDQLFRVRTTEEQRDNSGKLLSNIQCEHVYYDSHDCAFFPIFEMIGETPEEILTAAFAGTRFSIGTVEITTPTDIILEKAYPHGIVTQLIENVGGELVKDDWTINLVNKRGVNTGVKFRFGKNLKTIKKHKDATNIITRLYPYGKDGMQIPGALGYINSALLNTYDRPKIGHIDYKDIEDPDELLAAALKEWSTAEMDGIDKPRVTYSGNSLELKKLKEYGDYEAYGLGDVVGVIDDDLSIDTVQRIMEYENYPYEPKASDVSLSNTNPKVYRDNRPSNIISGTIKTTDYVDAITDSSNKLNPQWFQNIKRKLRTLFNGSLRDAVVHKTGDIWVDDPDDPTMAMAILSSGFAIANSKLENGDWDWKVFGTAQDGFVADLITAGILRGVTIEVTTDAKIGNKITLGNEEEIGVSKYIRFFERAANPNGTQCYIRVWEEAGKYYMTIRSADDLLLFANGGNVKLSGQNIELVEGNIIGTWNFMPDTVSGLEDSGYALKSWAAQKGLNTDSDSHSHTVEVEGVTYTTSSRSHSHGQN